MTTENTTGTAAENSATAEATPQGNRTQEKTVPYGRFQEVVEQRKGLESTLNALVDGMVQELPEDMRDLVPNLPPAEKVSWIRTAMQKGLFTQQAPVSSPDAKRPGGRPPQDLNSMTPVQMMSMGYDKG